MRIQHNIMAMSAYRNYTNNVSAMKKNLEKLSSGYKINRAGDDAAGLAISEKMRAQITGLETAQKNAKDGISLVQTAEGALTEVHDMLNRMVELATQSANGTYDNTTDRKQMQKEVNQLLEEIDRIADSSNFNGINLLDGSLGLNKDAFALEQVSDVSYTVNADGVVGDITAANNTANAVTKLHTEGTDGVKGSFVVYLGQASVTAPASGKANINVTIGSVTKKLEASSTKTALSASKIASQWLAASANGGGNGLYFCVTANGTKSFAKDTAAALTAAGAKGLVYKGTAAGGNITYELQGFVNAKGTAVTAAAASGSNLTAANVGSGAFIDLNLDVKIAAGSVGTTTVNAANVGTNPHNSVMKKEGQMGSAEIAFDTTKLEEGMTIKIGDATKTISLDKDNATADINLSEFVGDDGKISAENATKALDKIAKAFRGAATGIDVGVNANGKLTLSENAQATASVKTAMSNIDTFKGLLQVTKQTTGDAAQITVKSGGNKIGEGDALTVTDASGNKTKYVFTKESDKTDAKDGSVRYVQISDADTASAVTTKLNAKIGNGEIKTNGDGDKYLLVGNVSVLGRGLTLQIGDTSDPWNQLNVSVQDMHSKSLGIGGLDIASEAAAQNAIDKIKDAINTVSDVRGTLGATQNRLDHTINNLSVMTENIQDAESTIRDVDVAEEMMAYTKNNILIQSAQAMLAQANQVPQGVLQLLQ